MRCPNCCGCPTSVSVALRPGSWTGAVGSTFSFTPWETDWSNCGQNTYPIVASFLSPWISSDASVASVDQSGVISCRAGGSTQVSGDGFFVTTDVDYNNLQIEACPAGSASAGAMRTAQIVPLGAVDGPKNVGGK